MKINSFLKKWNHTTFEDWGGVISPEYKEFQNNYKSVIKDFCKEINMELVSFNGKHYEFSAVLRSFATNKYYYISISDVRYWRDDWNESILYRTMEHEKDWTGGMNHYSNLNMLPDLLKKMDLMSV